SVDRTPFHTEYVQAKTRDNPRLKSEIRLLKRFMKAQKVYGAEEKTRGFSGYLVEVLTIHYGSFLKVLEAAKDWSVGYALDPENLWGDEKSLKYYFTKSAIIVVDPVDKNRNMGAAVSRQKLAEFIIASREFLENPSIEFFFPPKKQGRPVEELKRLLGVRGTYFIAFKFSHPQLNENLLYSQLRKTMASIEKSFEDREFRVFRPSFWSNEADTSVILFEMTVHELPKIKHHPGPPVNSEPVHQERFHEKYEKDGPYILEGRWVVDTERKNTRVRQVAEKLEKTRDGFGKNLRKARVEILEGDEIFSIEHADFLMHLDGIL
ncbi:MAG TPA: CCA tRNA nucleotidyltransferase, partial [Candidatus Altiarchaeales archaeon]|nr:CCA tRNA nucleotidyltransferase [Candidatus Altiarchaeales archaeon]